MTNSVYWFKQSATGFYVSVTGFLGATGEVWGGTVTSPNGRWRVTYPKTRVQADISGGFKHAFGTPGISGKQLTGKLTFGTGGGATGVFSNVPWGARTGEIWNFQSGGQPAANWEGNAYLTLYNVANMADFSTWRFTVDILVRQNN